MLKLEFAFEPFKWTSFEILLDALAQSIAFFSCHDHASYCRICCVLIVSETILLDRFCSCEWHRVPIRGAVPHY
jgi:hypothetical protein